MKDQLMTTLDNSRNYTLAVAEAMHGNHYNTRPAEAVWNFGALLNHIAYGIDWWKENYITGKKTEWNPPSVKESKEAVIANLKQAYHSFETTVKKEKLTDDAVKGFHATIDHITHHRGQAVLHLRCQGIVPPEYVY